MMLLDVPTGVFQIAIVFVLFYLIGEAGGGNAGGAVNSAQGYARRASSAGGGAIGGGTSKAVGALGSRTASGFKSGFKKLPK